MSEPVVRELRPALLTYLQTLMGDDLARAVFANAVWGDTAAYRALADNLDLDTVHGFRAAQQLAVPGPPMSERPQTSRMKGTPFENDVFEAAVIVANNKRGREERLDD